MPPARPEPLEIGPRRFEWGRRTYVMGILNATPDSFSGDGLTDPGEAVRHALRMREEGADIIDVGGESTRPGWTPVDADEELRRVLPVIERLREAAPGLPISIDTAKPRVAAAAFPAGASLLNDVNGLRGDPDLARVAAEHGVPVVAMHNQRGREPSGDPGGRAAPGHPDLARRGRRRRHPARADHPRPRLRLRLGGARELRNPPPPGRAAPLAQAAARRPLPASASPAKPARSRPATASKAPSPSACSPSPAAPTSSACTTCSRSLAPPESPTTPCAPPAAATAPMPDVFLGIGGNLGDREANMRRAVELLRPLLLRPPRLRALRNAALGRPRPAALPQRRAARRNHARTARPARRAPAHRSRARPPPRRPPLGPAPDRHRPSCSTAAR